VGQDPLILSLEDEIRKKKAEIAHKTSQFHNTEEKERNLNQANLNKLLGTQLAHQKALETTQSHILVETYKTNPHERPELHDIGEDGAPLRTMDIFAFRDFHTGTQNAKDQNSGFGDLEAGADVRLPQDDDWAMKVEEFNKGNQYSQLLESAKHAQAQVEVKSPKQGSPKHGSQQGGSPKQGSPKHSKSPKQGSPQGSKIDSAWNSYKQSKEGGGPSSPRGTSGWKNQSKNAQSGQGYGASQGAEGNESAWQGGQTGWGSGYQSNESWNQKSGNESWYNKQGNESWDNKAGNESWNNKQGNESWNNKQGNESWDNNDGNTSAWQAQSNYDAQVSGFQDSGFQESGDGAQSSWKPHHNGYRKELDQDSKHFNHAEWTKWQKDKRRSTSQSPGKERLLVDSPRANAGRDGRHRASPESSNDDVDMDVKVEIKEEEPRRGRSRDARR